MRGSELPTRCRWFSRTRRPSEALPVRRISPRGRRLPLHATAKRAAATLAGATSLALIVKAMVGCAGLPREPEPVTRQANRASQYLTFGNSALDRGEFEEASEFFRIALEHAHSVDDQERVAAAYNGIGRAHRATGATDRASTYFDLAVEAAEPAESKRHATEARCHLAMIALDSHGPDEARVMLNAALEGLDRREHPIERAIVLHHMGITYVREDEVDLAEEHLRSALEINRRQGDDRTRRASNKYMLASVYSTRGEYDTAFEWAKGALELDKLVENSRGIMDSLHALGRISYRAGRYEESESYLRRSLATATAITHASGVERALRDLADVAEARGRSEAAEQYRSELDAQNDERAYEDQ